MAEVISATRLSRLGRLAGDVVFLLLGVSLASAGRVTATYPLPKPVTVSALQQDTAGDVYLAGYTGPTQGSPPDFWDAFVAKLSSAGTVLFWTTFGGSKADYVRAMAIAPDGSISVVGSTFSTEPVAVTADAGAINGVWQAQIAIPLGWSGPSLQFTLTVNGVAVRDPLVLWLK